MEIDNKLILIILLSFVLGSCAAQHSSNPQVSKNIEDSKNNAIFLKEYYVKNRLDSLNITEAWLEKFWRYDKDSFGNVTIKPSNSCQLCFKVRQTPENLFNIENFDLWRMKDTLSENFVGFKVFKRGEVPDGVYSLYINDFRCNTFDTITVNLTQIKIGKYENKRFDVGNLVFVPKE